MALLQTVLILDIIKGGDSGYPHWWAHPQFELYILSQLSTLSLNTSTEKHLFKKTGKNEYLLALKKRLAGPAILKVN